MTGMLTDQVAVITGGAGGIGRAIAKRFAKAGADIVIADVNEDGGQETVQDLEAKGHSAEFVRTDVTDPEAVAVLMDVTVERFGALDILVSNAGASAGDDVLHRVDVDTWHQLLELNLSSHFYCANAALPHLVDTGGSIVFMSSVNGLTGIGLASYSTAKSGILGLSRLLATHYGRHGVRSNVLCPGTIQSEAHAEKREEEWSEEQWNAWLDEYPLGRFGRPDEVADAACFLASDRSSFMTGQELVLDGGLTASLHHSLLRKMYPIDAPPTTPTIDE